ncbi:MAG: DMT family transporter [Anaerolineae bacterium]|nr:DMT family transporter [Anaerolineae bacterium]
MFNHHDTNLTRGYIITLISAAILSTTAIFIRYLTATYHMPALILAFWRDLMVTVTLVLVLGLVRPALLRVERRHLPYLIGYGLILAIFNALWTLSVALNGAAISTVLVYSSAAFTALLGWLLLKEQLTWAKVVAVTFSLGGCILISGAFDPAAWQLNLIGILTGISSGLLYAIYSLMGRAAAQRQINPWTTVLYTFGVASILLVCVNLFFGDLVPGAATQPADLWWLGDAVTGWLVLFLLAAGPTVIGFGLYNVSLSYLLASVANLIVTLEPVFTAVMAYILFSERLSAVQVGGSLLIMAGVIFLRLADGRSALPTRQALNSSTAE